MYNLASRTLNAYKLQSIETPDTADSWLVLIQADGVSNYNSERVTNAARYWNHDVTQPVMVLWCTAMCLCTFRLHSPHNVTIAIILIIGFCILLRVILTIIRTETCREYRSYLIKYFVNCCETEGIIIYSHYFSSVSCLRGRLMPKCTLFLSMYGWKWHQMTEIPHVQRIRWSPALRQCSMEELTVAKLLNPIMVINHRTQQCLVLVSIVTEIFFLDDRRDRLCGLVVTVLGLQIRRPGFDSRHYQIFRQKKKNK
jgi:hypothetical protein